MPGNRDAHALGRTMAVLAGRTTPEDTSSGLDRAPPGWDAQPVLVREPGGDTVDRIVPELFTPYDHMQRVLTSSAWFSPLITPQRPIQAQIINIQVPNLTELVLFDYEFALWGYNEVGGTVRLPGDRFTTILGFRLRMSSMEGPRGDVEYALVPTPATDLTTGRPLQRQQFVQQNPTIGRPSPVTNPYTIEQQQRQQYASQAGGTSLLPPEERRYGARDMPWSMRVKQGQGVEVVCVVTAPLPEPVAFVSGRLSGHLIAGNDAAAIEHRLRVR